MKTIKSGIVYKRTYEGMSEEEAKEMLVEATPKEPRLFEEE